MKRNRFGVVLLVHVLVTLALASSGLRAAEVRGIWVTRWDYRTEKDVRDVIRRSASLGINRVFFQVRGRADAFYKSSIEPWGEELGGVDPGFDPLEVALDEAEKAHIALDAWINVMPGWKGSQPPRSSAHVFYEHPEWFLLDNHGKRHLKNAMDYTILNPCLPEVRAYLVGVVKDIVTRYKVGGVQLDYIRFLSRGQEGRLDFPYDARTLALFQKYSGGSPSEQPAVWDKWRGLAVDTLVYRIAEAAREARPGLRVSVAAIQDYTRAKKSLFQDVVKWQDRGWVDEVYPMTYHPHSDAFSLYARNAVSRGKPGKVFPGVGAYQQDSAGEMARQIDLCRSMGAGGYCLFAYTDFYPSASHESSDSAAAQALRSDRRATLKRLNSEERPRAVSKKSLSTAPAGGALAASPAGGSRAKKQKSH